MKKIIYSLFGLLIALSGCVDEGVWKSEQQLNEGIDVTVSFSASIPDFKTVNTRATGGVNDMYLLVFDENGSFIVRKKASLTNQSETGGTFTASLPSSSKRRIVHFISNLGEEAFNDSPGVNEATVVALLSTTSTTFWSRVELNSGISATSFNGITVQLLRNQAKISVINEASNFTYNGFVIHNTPQQGTIAPYSAATGFLEGTVSEPSGVTLLPALLSGISTGEKYLFERKNASASNITTVIVRGTYEGESYYYKIDLIDSNKNRYNIERNYHYVVKIQSVTRAGFSSFNDALAGASHNNTALDPVIEKYPMISDGNSKLEVEKTLVILTQPNQTFQVWAKYFPDISSDEVNNTGVTVSLQTGNSAINAASLNFNPTTGIISGTSLSAYSVEPGVALIRVSKGELARTVRVVFRTPFQFDPITINNANPGTVGNAQSSNVSLRFTIPDDFPEDLFPLPIQIHANGLYPAASGLEMVVEGDRRIHYIYRAAQKGEQTVHFKTNLSGNAESVILKADYFTDGMVGYNLIYRTGNLTYGSSSKPVPYALRNNLSATSGTLYMPANEDGKYIWAISSTSAGQSQTVSFDITEGFTRSRYSSTFTPNNSTNIHLNSVTILGFLGSITYGGNGSVLPGTPMHSGVGIVASTGSIQVNSTGSFIYTPPASYNNNTSVTFTYEKQVNSNYKEKYSVTTTIGNLRNDGTILMVLTDLIFEGTIKHYRSSSWRDVPSDGTVSISSGPGSIEMTSTGNYRYTVTASTNNSQSVTFRYNRKSYFSSTNYEQIKTIAELKTVSSLQLQ